jgi:polyisoprenoid-binding protein YceI
MSNLWRKLLPVLAVVPLSAAPVRFEVIYPRSVIAVKTDKTGLLSAFGAGHRHGIVAGEFSAQVCAEPRTFEDASVSVRVPVSALRIDTDEARRVAGVTSSGPSAKDIPVIQQKMLSPANLDAAAHPEIRFQSSAATRSGDGINLRGVLTIRGRSTQIAVPLRVQPAAGDYRFSGQFNIKLRDYGITPESVGGVVKVADEVTVLIDLLTRPGKEPCR